MREKRIIICFIIMIVLVPMISACSNSDTGLQSNQQETIEQNDFLEENENDVPVEEENVVFTEEGNSTQEGQYEDGLGEDGFIHVYLVGPGEKENSFKSSFIDYLIYYKESGHLIISMNGKEYVFANVSESMWEDFKEAESKGKFYNDRMKNNPQYHIKDYNGNNGDLIVVEHIDN